MCVCACACHEMSSSRDIYNPSNPTFKKKIKASPFIEYLQENLSFSKLFGLYDCAGGPADRATIPLSTDDRSVDTGCRLNIGVQDLSPATRAHCLQDHGRQELGSLVQRAYTVSKGNGWMKQIVNKRTPLYDIPLSPAGALTHLWRIF